MANPTSTLLDDERYLSLETFRSDGSGVKTPVWAAPSGGKLVVVTDGTSFKARRIRNNPSVRVAGCNSSGKEVHGAWHAGTVRFLEDKAAQEEACVQLAKKYGWQFMLLNLISRVRGSIKNRVFLEITVDAK